MNPACSQNLLLTGESFGNLSRPWRSAGRPRRSGAGPSSISASVVAAPRLKRTEERRRSSGTRMATRVGEGRVEPLAQAEPSEAATPARSSCISRASPSRPGKPTFRVCGSRRRRVGRAVADDAIGAEGGDQARLEAVAERPPAGWRASASACQRSRAAARPTARGTATVPGRRPCCWPPPKRPGAELDPLADQQQADADRAVELVGAGRQGRDPQGVEVDRDPADGLHGVGVDRDPAPRARAARRATGWIAPVSLLASIRVASRVSARKVAAIALGVGQALGVDGAGDRRRTRPPRAGRPARRPPGARSGWRRRGPGPRSAPARPKIARLFASVPPDVKIDLARVGPQDPGDRLLGLLPGPPRRAAGGVPALGVARRPASTAASPRAPRGRRPSSRCGRGRSGACIARAGVQAGSQAEGPSGSLSPRSGASAPGRRGTRGCRSDRSGPAQSATPTTIRTKPNTSPVSRPRVSTDPDHQPKGQRHDRPDRSKHTLQHGFQTNTPELAGELRSHRSP